MPAHTKAFLLTAVVTVGAGLVSAVSLPDLSSSCSASLKGLLTSPDAACLNPSAVLAFVVGSEASVPKTIDNWLNGICSTGSCTNETIAAIATNITTGCSEDLAKIGASVDVNQVIGIAQQVYPTARKVGCLKDTTANTLCVTQTFNNIESVVGQLGLNNVTSFDLGSVVGELGLNNITSFDVSTVIQQLVSSGIKSIACTDCMKEAYTIAKQDFSSIVSLGDQEVQQVCGADFTDGSLPATIAQTQASGVFSTAPTNGAFSLSPIGGIAGIVLAVSSAIFVLLG